MTNQQLIEWAMKQPKGSLFRMEPPTPPQITVASMKRRHANAQKKAESAQRFQELISLPANPSNQKPSGDAGNLTDHRTGRDFIYTKPPKIPYRRPGGTYGEPTGKIFK